MDSSYAKEYERLYQQHWWWLARKSLIQQEIGRLKLPLGHNLLDIGCGGGWSFEMLEQYGEVYGVEKDPSLVQLAGPRAEHIHCGEFDHTCHSGKSFALILMLDVLEHLPEPAAALETAIGLLDPGGKILITVPAMPALWTTHDDLNHHYVRYTRSTLRNLAESSALRIDKLHYFYHWLVPLKLMVRAKEAMVETTPTSPGIPPAPINSFFRIASRIEQKLAPSKWLPFGSSLLCIGGRD